MLGLNGPKASDKTGDPGQYDPHSSVTGAGKKSFGYEEKHSPSVLEKLKAKGKKGYKFGTFGGGTAKRELRMDLMGEATPGPGTYMPASTFGKNAVSKEAQQQMKRPSSAFKSTSLQRAKPGLVDVPGPGAHSPNHKSIEKNTTNPGNSLIAKSKRFGAGGAEGPSASTAAAVGPGAYDSHVIGSVADKITKNVERMSRQNPGFGIAGPSHELPFEQPVEDDQDLPGPGKYENLDVKEAVHPSSSGHGHSSSFKLPTKRTKGPPDEFGAMKEGAKKDGKSKSDTNKATIHV